MDLTQIILLIIGTCLAVIGYFVAKTIDKMEKTIEGVADSISTIKTNMAVLMEKQSSNEKSIEDHDDRIRIFERFKQV